MENKSNQMLKTNEDKIFVNNSTLVNDTLENFNYIEKNQIDNLEHNDKKDIVSRVKLSKMIISTRDQNNTVKNENINNFETTDDESMAVEALRQLGGMFTNVQEPDFSLLSCTLCDNKFHTTAELHSHFIICKESMMNNTSLSCTNCQEIFNDRQEYEVHNCLIQELLTCKFCENSFFNKIDYEHHMNTFHIDENNQNYKCSVCNLSFLRPTSLKNHMKIHTYIPGRALTDFEVINDQENETSEKIKWSNEYLLYVDKNDTLNSYNYADPSCLVQTELNPDMNLSIGQEMVINSTCDDSSNSPLENTYQNDLIFNHTIKMESIPLPEVDKMDASFPITSLPQMEVTIDCKRPHACNHCDATFTRAKALSSHMKLHVIGWPNKYECESCGESFENEQIKLDHKENCLLNNTLLLENKIKNENISLKTGDNNKKNVNKTLSRVGKHFCPECQKKFTTKQKMYRHLWIHRKKTYSCEMCASTFVEQVALDRHRLSEHPVDSPYVCQECGKCFASRQGLWEHGRVHGTGTAGLFKCIECKKTFTSRQGYLIHNRMHTGERPYGCRFCMKAFRDGGTLRKHERIHTGERPHVCPICMHDFNQKVVLREHVRWVHVASKIQDSDGLFECQLCNSYIKDKEELCAHIVKHSDQIAARTKSVKNKTVNVNSTLTNCNKKSNIDKPITSKHKIIVKENNKQTVVNNLTENNVCVTSNDKIKSCDMCGINFNSQKELMIHVQVHI